jgi:NADH-quinone oxidoreductase subunit K
MNPAIPLEWYLILAAALFCIGIYGVLSRRNAVMILMGVELMLNAVNINLVAFWRYMEPEGTTGQAFALFVYAVAAAEVAVGLALIIAIWRTRNTVILDDVDLLQG